MTPANGNPPGAPVIGGQRHHHDAVPARVRASRDGQRPDDVAAECRRRPAWCDAIAAVGRDVRDGLCLLHLVGAPSAGPGGRLVARDVGSRPTLLTSTLPVTGSITMPCTPARPSNAALPSTALSCTPSPQER